MQHISGQDFDVMIGDALVTVETMNASITDNRQSTPTRGIPNGHVNGDVSCSGEIEVDDQNFNLLAEQAKSAGSWRELPVFDIICVAETGDNSSKRELFGCLLKLSDILNIDSKGAEKHKNKIGFEVTSSDFVRINGVPYLSENDVRDL